MMGAMLYGVGAPLSMPIHNSALFLRNPLNRTVSLHCYADEGVGTTLTQDHSCGGCEVWPTDKVKGTGMEGRG